MLEHEDSDEVYFSDEYLIKFEEFWVYEVSLHKLKWYVFTVVVRKKLKPNLIKITFCRGYKEQHQSWWLKNDANLEEKKWKVTPPPSQLHRGKFINNSHIQINHK